MLGVTPTALPKAVENELDTENPQSKAISVMVNFVFRSRCLPLSPLYSNGTILVGKVILVTPKFVKTIS